MPVIGMRVSVPSYTGTIILRDRTVRLSAGGLQCDRQPRHQTERQDPEQFHELPSTIEHAKWFFVATFL
jgi:hypothetical protein